MSSRLRLVIKAANGSVDDFKVEAEVEWSVRQLKGHLYRHYPTHPPLSSQRLIHSGQLLLDQQLIRQLPNFQDETLVIHLVAFERSVSAPVLAPSQSPAASRQTSLSPVEETEALDSGGDDQSSDGEDNETTQPQETEAQDSSQQNSLNQPPTFDPWLRYRGPPQPHTEAAGGGGGVVYAPPNFQTPPPFHPVMPAGGGYAVPPPFPPPQYFVPPPYGFGYPPNNAHMTQWYQDYYQRLATPAEGNVREGGGDDLYDPQLLEDPEQLHDNEEDVAMNAGALGLMGGANFQHRRDMVDYLYMLTMAGFLALVAFLTGSFGRLLIFFAGVLFMLLNQAGWFSLQRRAVAVPPAANEVAPPPQEPAHIRPEQHQGIQQEPPPPANESTDSDNPQQNAPDSEPSATSAAPESDQPPVPVPDQPPRNEPDRPGLATTIFVFVTSFFTSLVPQQRPEFHAN